MSDRSAEHPRGLMPRADGIPDLDRRAFRRVALVTLGGIVVGVILDLVFGFHRSEGLVYALGLDLVTAGYAGTIASGITYLGRAGRLRAPIADLPLDRQRAITRVVYGGRSATGAMKLSREELRRSVYYARTAVGSVSVALATPALLYLGIAGLQMMLGFPDDSPASTFRLVAVGIMAVAALILIPLGVVRIARARRYALREDHVLDEPLGASL